MLQLSLWWVVSPKFCEIPPCGSQMALNVNAHLISFPADSQSDEVNDDKKESLELWLGWFKAALKPIPTCHYDPSSAGQILWFEGYWKQWEMHVLVCVCFPAHTSSMGHGSGVCVQQHVRMQILCMEHHLGLWCSGALLWNQNRGGLPCGFFFCLSRFQAVPLPSLGLLVPLQHLEASWRAWLGASLKLGALPPNHLMVF